ncbi:NAD-dependent epimerase/dehydratase family protein [Sphingomonas sp. SUN039]|uniref:NAD-dependent epimerase/dehydratase family protein n=1 Tax=Sphingomonas sp. SUN039 TaxID=2937787 RepID=UPI0021648B0F|nr:NAD-dependent epimerase/dehydratase family protein [Sphingomonas sp. SUN039]UVO54347.1 NAD-dependent epimerase/dehydratase family protein [Sphingomonas sp. SUN039]
MVSPIIVTGAGGFVGRVLLESLVAEGRAVVGVDVAGGGIPPGVRAVAGDIASPELRTEVFRDGCAALVHLATVPGGAAEADPAASRRINIDAMYDLLDAAKVAGSWPRVVYASSIAVFGDPLPAAGVDDATPLAPKLVYGGHKAMMEIAVATMHHRGEIEGVSVRLPGILARPKGPSGMKSAFMSDLFHALREGQSFVCPVSPHATIWAESVGRCVANLRHALTMDAGVMPRTRVVTLPALRVTMAALAAEIAGQCGVSTDLVSYSPDPGLEAAFGAHPELRTPAADACGFAHDGDVAKLVASALETIARR